jgi:hypothetical protein
MPGAPRIRAATPKSFTQPVAGSHRLVCQRDQQRAHRGAHVSETICWMSNASLGSKKLVANVCDPNAPPNQHDEAAGFDRS